MTLLDARQLVVKKIDELKNRVKKLDKKPSLVIIRRRLCKWKICCK